MVLRNIPFGVEARLVRFWYRATGLRPTSRPFVSGDSFRAIADHCIEPGCGFDHTRVRRGEVVFVQASELRMFVGSILPQIAQPIVLVTHNGDLNIDESFRYVADDRKIIRWFAQDALLRHPKVTAIPIGLENRNFHYNGVLRDFRRLARRCPPKAMRIFYAFTVGTNERERKAALAALQVSRLAQGFGRTNSRTYRARLVRYGFVASPPGNGVDCHRTWEALYLGVIPIVKRSPFYEYFPGLPILAVDDWSEIAAWDEALLARAYEELSAQIGSCRYLRFDFWASLIAKAGQKDLT
jgi:hypothetical protein